MGSLVTRPYGTPLSRCHRTAKYQVLAYLGRSKEVSTPLRENYGPGNTRLHSHQVFSASIQVQWILYVSFNVVLLSPPNNNFQRRLFSLYPHPKSATIPPALISAVA